MCVLLQVRRAVRLSRKPSCLNMAFRASRCTSEALSPWQLQQHGFQMHKLGPVTMATTATWLPDAQVRPCHHGNYSNMDSRASRCTSEALSPWQLQQSTTATWPPDAQVRPCHHGNYGNMDSRASRCTSETLSPWQLQQHGLQMHKWGPVTVATTATAFSMIGYKSASSLWPQLKGHSLSSHRGHIVHDSITSMLPGIIAFTVRILLHLTVFSGPLNVCPRRFVYYLQYQKPVGSLAVGM